MGLAIAVLGSSAQKKGSREKFNTMVIENCSKKIETYRKYLGHFFLQMGNSFKYDMI